MGKFGHCPRERPSLGPETARMKRWATGEAVEQLVAVGAGGDPASTANVVVAWDPHFVEVAAAVVFLI